MGRVYTMQIPATAITAARDVWQLNKTSNMTARLLSFHLGQSTDYGDSEAEGLEVKLRRSTTGTVGTGGTLNPHDEGDAAATVTGEYDNPAASVSLTELHAWGMNIQAGLDIQFVPEEAPVFGGSSGAAILCLNVSAPTDSVSFSGYVTIEEIG